MNGTDEVSFWCGSYTGDKGEGQGVWALGRVDRDSANDAATATATAPAPAAATATAENVSVIGVAVETDSPSFLAAHPRHPLVYAVGEFVQTMQAYRRDGATLQPVGEAWHAGAAVCHVAVDPHARFAIACCWGDGQVVYYALDDDGMIVSRQSAVAADDPHPGGPGVEGQPRQSRAHMALILPDGRVLTADLGYDLVRVWRVGNDGLLLDHEVALPVGSGPRHLTWHPSGYVYVISELSGEVFVLGEDAAGRFAVLQQTSATLAGHHEGNAGTEITLSTDRAFVHTTMRGANVITTHAVRDGGSRLEAIDDTSCGGDWPRHHIERDGVLRVANQLSSTVTTFALDPASGIPQLVGTAHVGSPTCLLPVD